MYGSSLSEVTAGMEATEVGAVLVEADREGVVRLEISRDWHGKFVKGHKVPNKWKERFIEISKGKHYSPRTEFRKGLNPWNKGKENPAVKGNKNSMKRLE